MSFLKRLPIKYTGELHDVRLINFSILPEELEGMVPKGIRPRIFNGRALISMVDVKLENMRVDFVPGIFTFNYNHIAFRLVIDDSIWSGHAGSSGIHFLRSFTSNPIVAFGGGLLTNYNLKTAAIKEANGVTCVTQKENKLCYAVNNEPPVLKPAWLKEQIQSLDKAYSIVGDKVQYVQVQREKWHIEWVNCPKFAMDFFKSAQLEGAFRVNEVIYYTWLPPQNVRP